LSGRGSGAIGTSRLNKPPQQTTRHVGTAPSRDDPFDFQETVMFSKKKSTGIEQTKLATLIAQDVRITGDLQFSEGLRMDGHVKGNVSGAPGCQALLVLSERGSIEGTVHGYDVVVNGRIVGDLTADHFVELQANAHVVGNIYYQQLRMDCGASVDGKLTRREAAQVVQAAPPLLVAVDESSRDEHNEPDERKAG
jgi:cytoskeletal protein CcmA (bactofilin family)